MKFTYLIPLYVKTSAMGQKHALYVALSIGQLYICGVPFEMLIYAHSLK